MWPWLGWFLLTFVAWNSCASHAGARWSEGQLARGDHRLTPAFALAALRGAGTDDGDVSRYLAYANAALGRPYQPFYVRSLDGWTGPQPERAAGPDPDDPRETPPRRPDRPLVPYRDFFVEYPPGFFLLVLPPTLPGLDLDGYRLLFSCWMALLLTAALLAVIRIGRVLRPLATPSPVMVATLLALLLGTVAVRRFDAIVSLSLCLFLDGCLRRRPVLSGLALGMGLVTKLVPVLVVPVALIHWGALRRRRELAVAALVTCLVGLVVCVPFLPAAGGHLLDLIRYHGQRPLEVESTGAALLTIGRFFDPASAWGVEAYGFQNVVGPADRFLLPLADLAPLVATAGIAAWSMVQTRAAMRGADPQRVSGEVLVRAACATLAASMTLGKVFSAQYLVWLLPAGALVSVLDGGRRRRTAIALLAGAMLLTQLNQHLFFGLLGRGPQPLMGVLILARNALVMAWAVWILMAGPAARAAAEGGERPMRGPSGSGVEAPATLLGAR
ncbi:MAG TPA: glycosyltransferase 87 family protein [Myxococcaceae bacterium]|nr:glycosyltransferase 87 family protein [Myxococcaceae bacterium]